ncbi:CPBP family intramembrane metalloprotease [Propionibacterium freudenreichii]|uniref:CPBP family intramembrane glutamic endopeptidase n=1 Tax=Propionibacterium freudenreichii TaxID=1744 RepID=UPI000542C3B8|nr:CPBP family intramembrane glutamic endopeptidase [Propionibacterium freudenreichii]MCT3013005.1 CPBP family intramembrane metalloprotease [Propionibacterium freudenreichii]MDK9295903.1 CPBP family intramembrane metalloprotease [Propionibacterium freudenreichii]MDK9361294.1 CPBP family intramembrane metalloprotease [Propionibacterium freudenreichii]MDK9611157.1 CPBP family intramembrane metalloprotease [Propionibacterium freudenreichii]MDK9620548.1 CPBP family intramembrane metalloprotease [
MSDNDHTPFEGVPGPQQWGPPQPVQAPQPWLPYPNAAPSVAGGGPTAPGWQYAPLRLVERDVPTTPTHYHGFWRTQRWRWWRVLLAAVVTVVGFFAAGFAFGLFGYAIDFARTGTVDGTGSGLTAGLFLGNNLALASLIPIALLVSLVFRQPMRWMSSVTGHFRWRWFGASLAWCLPFWIVLAVLSAVLGEQGGLGVNKDTVFMIFAVLLTTPLQCVGEEFLCRGVINRGVASFFPQTTRLLQVLSAIAGGAVSSVVFMLLHNAGDVWLNANYFLFASIGCYLGWVTGGLEASCAMHIVNNLTAMVTLPFTDFSGMFNREAGSSSPAVLVIDLAPVVLAAIVLTWRAHRKKITNVSAPGAAGPTAPPAPAQPIQPPLPMASPAGPPVRSRAPRRNIPRRGTGVPASSAAAPGWFPAAPAGAARDSPVSPA